MAERALYYRDQCLEWAALTPLPEIKIKMQAQAASWEKFAANLRRDAEAIERSHIAISKANDILNR